MYRLDQHVDLTEGYAKLKIVDVASKSSTVSRGTVAELVVRKADEAWMIGALAAVIDQRNMQESPAYQRARQQLAAYTHKQLEIYRNQR